MAHSTALWVLSLGNQQMRLITPAPLINNVSASARGALKLSRLHV
jgi:hypothetical protein